MGGLTNLEARLRAVEDRLEIQALAARFSDAVNGRDVPAFAKLWASDRPIWEIGPPLQSCAQGIDEITAMLQRLLQIERYFMQMTHSGVVTIDGDRATARFVERERGRGDGSYYDNLAVYDDVLVREPGGWRFLERHYRYRFLDQRPFEGDAFRVSRDKARPIAPTISHSKETN
jgi:ketosteroid isomerase-like protein